MSQTIFPPPVEALPLADIPLPGLTARLAQGEGHQILFMEFALDAALPEHAHAGQWGIVLDGEIELTVGGVPTTYRKGDRYFIPAGVPHSARIRAGYADITFFAQQNRYQTKPT